jgi:hypothetical protein
MSALQVIKAAPGRRTPNIFSTALAGHGAPFVTRNISIQEQIDTMSAGIPTKSLKQALTALESLSSPGAQSPSFKFTDGGELMFEPQAISSNQQVGGDLGLSSIIPEELYNKLQQALTTPCYRQIPFRLASVLGTPNSVVVGDGATTPGLAAGSILDTGAFLIDWIVPGWVGPQIQKFTYEDGVQYSAFDNVIRRIAGCCFSDLTLTSKRSDSPGSFQGSIAGYGARTTATPTTANTFDNTAYDNATVDLDVSAATGTVTWTSRVTGESTTFAAAATSATIQTALRTFYGGAYVTVVDGITGHKTITYISAMGLKPVELSLVTSSGGTISLSYMTAQPTHYLVGGVARFDPLIPMVAAHAKNYYGNSPTDIFNAANVLTDGEETEIKLQKFHEIRFTEDSDFTSYSDSRPVGVDDGRVQTISATRRLTRSSIALLDDWINRADRWFGRRMISPQMAAGTTPFAFEISGKVGVQNYSDSKENKGVKVVTCDHPFLIDKNLGYCMFRVRCVVDVSAITRT